MPVSSSSMKIRYSLTFSVTDQEARMAIGMRNVVSKTKKILMPSTPTMYSMPKPGIHGTRSTNCISPLMPSNRLKTMTDQTNASPLASNASEKSAAVCRRGVNMIIAAPITGMARTMVKLPMATPGMVILDRDSRRATPARRPKTPLNNAARCRSGYRPRSSSRRAPRWRRR